MPFLTNINQLRPPAVEWGKTYLWDIKFENAPSPFNEFFPAIDVEENLLTLESFQFNGFISNYKVPKSTGVFDLKITFNDDINNTLALWFEDWINQDILGNGLFVRTIEEIVRLITLVKLNSKREQLEGQSASYWVYPEGSLNFHGDSQPGVPAYSIDLIIMGKK